MRSVFSGLVAFLLLVLLSNSSSAVELLTSGNFEPPGDVGEAPGWTLLESVTGSAVVFDSAAVTGGANTGENAFRLNAWAGGGPISAEEGNFDGRTPHAVNGSDFLQWQLGNSPTAGSDTDLGAWEAGYGRVGGQQTNGAITQTVPAVAGRTYTFLASSRWEDNYSGGVEELDAGGPLGDAPSPTQTTLKMEFLTPEGTVIGTPVTLDVSEEQLNFNVYVDHSLMGTAPAGTGRVRVTAGASNMVWNGAETTPPGQLQAAFFDTFSLKDNANSEQELLTNPDLEDPIPSAFDFWELTETPDPCCAGQVLRTQTASWANHTPPPEGSTGVWLSAFFGASPSFEAVPVSGTMAQTVPALPNETYTFSGWSRFEGNYSGGVDIIANDGDALFANMESPTKTEITLEFYNSEGALISSETIDVKADREMQICGGSSDCANDGSWYQHTLQAISPPGTVSARLIAGMYDGVYNTNPQQSAFFDDFSLDGPAVSPLAAQSAVPEATSLVSVLIGALLLASQRTRGGARVC